MKYVDRFGFDIDTCCGYYPQDNTWNDDWVKFYARKIEQQIQYLKGDREASDLWSQVLPKLDTLFKDVDVKPALLHGDLWSGNAAADQSGPGKGTLQMLVHGYTTDVSTWVHYRC